MATSHAGGPGLIEAAKDGDIEKVKAHLAAGTPVDSKDSHGESEGARGGNGSEGGKRTSYIPPILDHRINHTTFLGRHLTNI